MPEQDTNEARVIEPLAKFHARLDVEGRIVVPKYVRDALGISPQDYLQISIRKVLIDSENKIIYILDEVQFVEQLQRRGSVRIPHKIRKSLELEPEDLVEVLIWDFYKPDEPKPHTHFKYVRKK
jgi:AbrB family looped-hinge helix DNA binding protein